MNESGSSRVRAMSKLMTPSVARAAGMISESTAISASLFSGLECILNRRMTIGPPVDGTQLGEEYGVGAGIAPVLGPGLIPWYLPRAVPRGRRGCLTAHGTHTTGGSRVVEPSLSCLPIQGHECAGWMASRGS